jgi:type VI secretion system protein ImpG
MRDDLLLYYENELAYLRQMGAQFAEKYPKIASRLLLEPSKESEDPHVERLIEAFAFLAARVHLKVDDDFPEITEALLGIVYPHFIQPLPSMSIVEFQVDLEQGKLTSGLTIKRDTPLYSRPVGGVPCKFRTCYDTTLWPLAVTAAEWRSPDRLQGGMKVSDATFALRLELKSPADVPLPKLGVDKLRFYLSGDGSMVHTLYELLCSRLNRVIVRDPSNPKLLPSILPPSAIRPVGFTEDEGMIPYPRRSFLGYRLLQEFFSIPAKFLFVDIAGLDELWANGYKDTAELIFLFTGGVSEERRQRLMDGIAPKTFRLGCTPVVNLFEQTAEPILIEQHRYEYQVIPDVRRMAATEIFSIDEVGSIDPDTRQTVTYRPFYSYRQDTADSKSECFWIANRRASTRLNDDASDLYISLVDRAQRPLFPETDTLTVRTTCTNRNLPSRLPFGSGGEDADFELEGNAPIKRIVSLMKPTVPLRPPSARMALWHLISHLSLNYLSLVEEGRESLQQILRLYDFTESQFAEKMIDGIAGLKSRPHFARVVSENGVSFARGTRIEIEFDEDQFVGGGVYLFASVLEQFFALYASLNSFTQLVAKTRRRGEEVLREWPPRAGKKILL